MKSLLNGLLALHCLSVSANAAERVDYAHHIKPLLKQRCYPCHGALKQKAGLRLDTGAAIRKGGKQGPVVLTNDVARSPLILRVASKDPDERMPQEGEPLTAEQIALLEAWIREGAISPAEEQPEPDPREHWAFKKPARPPVPRISNVKFEISNPIDAFLAVEWQKRGLTPSPPTDKPTLLRRVYLDLIGLPPTREELHAFLADTSRDAYERVVDSLLQRPEYGERWARHWMDIWRYADWYGRRQVPDVWNSAPQIWRWRDWIVRSLNADKGYDRMIQEMLAGDELAPEDDETVVATGFLVRNWYALNPNQWMRDNVEHTAKAFLGLTLNCAHCHDHKYDPISQREYFQFRAFFEPLGLRQDWVQGEPDPGAFQKYDYSIVRKVAKDGLVRVLDEHLDARTHIYLRGDERNLPPDKPTVEPAVPTFLDVAMPPLEEVALPARTQYPGLKEFIREARLAEREKAVAAAKGTFAEAERKLAETREQAAKVFVVPASAGESSEQTARSVPADVPPAEAGTTTDTPFAHTAKSLTELLKSETALVSAASRLAVAEAELAAVKARLAADLARFLHAGGDTNQLAGAASKAERVVTLLTARQKLTDAESAFTLLQAEQSLAAARRHAESADATREKKAKEDAEAMVKKSTEQIAALKKAVETAEATLATNSPAYTPLSPTYPTKSTGRRRALAQWITSRDNPLTARVAVNHIWARHFHAPLVASVFDFGRNGAAPTHPELLDWLAVEWMEHGWRMKHLHRLVLTSGAYRMASREQDGNTGRPEDGSGPFSRLPVFPPSRPTDRRASELDPENLYLWRMNPGQMEAEVVRDSLLYLAGDLDPTAGGYPLPNTEADKSRRRSLYFECYPEEGGHSDFTKLFDPPDPGECYRRTKTIVPQQALALTNSKLSIEASRVLAKTLSERLSTQSTTDDEAFVRASFEQILSRPPSAEESSLCREFLQRQTEIQRENRAQEFSDTKVGAPASVLPPDLRARASLVHALFNHNDFVTIR
jgi:hypothetical protein